MRVPRCQPPLCNAVWVIRVGLAKQKLEAVTVQNRIMFRKPLAVSGPVLQFVGEEGLREMGGPGDRRCGTRHRVQECLRPTQLRRQPEGRKLMSTTPPGQREIEGQRRPHWATAPHRRGAHLSVAWTIGRFGSSGQRRSTIESAGQAMRMHPLQCGTCRLPCPEFALLGNQSPLGRPRR